MILGLVPIFVLLGVGVACRRFGLLNQAGAATLNALVANIALPALFISTVGPARLDTSLSWRSMAVCVGVVVLATGAAVVCARLAGLPRDQRGVVAQAVMRGNVVYFTFPLILSVYGQPGLQLAAVTSTALIPAMNLIAVAVLELHLADHRGWSRVASRVVANPLVIAALLSLALAAVSWRPWPWLASSIKTLADMAFPGALLALGAQLAPDQWRSRWRPLAGVSLGKLILLPAAAWFLLHLLGASPLEQAVGVLLMAAPTAVASNAVAADLGGDTELAGSCVLVTTVLSVATYIAWVAAMAVAFPGLGAPAAGLVH
jgi:hypothetical protein